MQMLEVGVEIAIAKAIIRNPKLLKWKSESHKNQGISLMKKRIKSLKKIIHNPKLVKK